MKKKREYKGQNVMIRKDIHAMLVRLRKEEGVMIAYAIELAIKAWLDANYPGVTK